MRRNSKWNDIKSSQDFNGVRQKSLAFTKDLAFFEGKNENEIEGYVENMGQSIGFL